MGKHTVARHYLRGFSTQPMHKNPPLFMYERGETEPKEILINKIAQSKKYWSGDVEDFLTKKIENPANPVLDKIRREETITYQEKGIFAVYLVNLLQRVPYWRKKILVFEPKIDQILLAEFDADIDLQIEKQPDQREKLEIVRTRVKDGFINNQKIISKQTYGKFLQSPLLTQGAGQILQEMDWQFWICPESIFVTGDNPVFFSQDLGLTNIHAELSFPIAPRLAMTAGWNQGFDRTFTIADEQTIREINRRTIFSSRFAFSGTRFEWIPSFWQNV